MKKFKFVIAVNQVSEEYIGMCSYHNVTPMETPYFLEVKTIEAVSFIKAESMLLEYIVELFDNCYYIGELEIGVKGTLNNGYNFTYNRERYDVAKRLYMDDLGDLDSFEDAEMDNLEMLNDLSEEQISAVLKVFLESYIQTERGDGSDDIAISIQRYLDQHKGEKIFFDTTAEMLMEVVGNYRADSVDSYIDEALRQLECSRIAIKNLKISE